MCVGVCVCVCVWVGGYNAHTGRSTILLNADNTFQLKDHQSIHRTAIGLDIQIPS